MPSTQELIVGTELEGVIVRDYGLWFDVQTDAGIVRATLRGILKRERVKTDPAAVGDRVRVSVASLETDPPEGAIEEVEPRTRVPLPAGPRHRRRRAGHPGQPPTSFSPSTPSASRTPLHA